MGRSISTYSRPKDLPEGVKITIEKMFIELHGDKVIIDWVNETTSVYGADGTPIRLRMEAIGKMFGIMQQHCVTVRKNKKDSKLTL